ncbi:metallophosphoesterase [Cryobacterium sp. PAMC25264]|uniref:metallophosphoesterase family protein n=1 Tax=Cryobacterium sp. PAMC25264 TaxID=2861288 RepID=UPI001C637C14|nr:metallophosphoesterase [Cryobacterium sp. PAMC25264]QYF74878.1 metallophosphoesterase [Cryobacterium sp. PAMC25264]
MGDLHGDLGHALQAFQTFAQNDVRVILQLGDWGVLWPGQNWQTDLNKMSRALSRHHQTFYFVDGNHDWHPKLQEFPVDLDGLRWISGNVAHLPRGYRSVIGGRFTLAALGGGNSTDRDLREEGKTWWPEEQIADADLERLGNDRVDVLVGHEAPLMDEADQDRRSTELGIPPKEAAYAAHSRFMFRRAVLQTRPRLTLGGHYHRFVDETLTLPGAPPTRVVVLDMNGPQRVNMAILHTQTLELDFLHRNGDRTYSTNTAPERTNND